MALPKLPPRHEEPPEDEEEELGGAMTFIEHLEELRERLIKSLLGFGFATILCLCISGTLFDLLKKPYDWGIGKERQPILNIKDTLAPHLDRFAERIRPYFFGSDTGNPAEKKTPLPTAETPTAQPASSLQSESPNTTNGFTNILAYHSMFEAFMVRIKISIVGGIFLAFPILFYQAWRFVAPGLYKREKRFIFPTILSAWFCFILGGLFAYFFVLPIMVYFFAGFSTPDIPGIWSMDTYFTNSLHITLAFGIVFEEPVVIMLLAFIGLIRYRHLKKWRPYVIVGIFVVAAVITPPDPFSQTMCAIPLLILYEGSAQCVRIYQRTRGIVDEEEKESEEEATT
ncbi:MAG TPA: twin-arginine translocase subunit TatC [bacterium]|nr:twin-arginine translocase subunit TatC [bacterium]HQL63703.1 twin-arginine translocase subunit TatC [bacterium]